MVSLVTSGAGLVLFTYGRKQARMPQVIGGLLLMVYPYFVSTLAGILVVGALIGGGVWVALRMGW